MSELALPPITWSQMGKLRGGEHSRCPSPRGHSRQRHTWDQSFSALPTAQHCPSESWGCLPPEIGRAVIECVHAAANVFTCHSVGVPEHAGHDAF